MVLKHLGDIKVRYDSICRVGFWFEQDMPDFLLSVKFSTAVDKGLGMY